MLMHCKKGRPIESQVGAWGRTPTGAPLSGVYRISARGELKVRPHTKSGGGGGGGQSTSGRYMKSGGGGGGGSPLQVRYLRLAHRKYVIVNNKQLQF